jgi:hypothetical protein
MSGGTSGLTFSGGPITTSGTFTAAGTLVPANGGTGAIGTPTAGQLLIGNGINYSVANLTAGSNITITNSPGGISIAAASGVSSFSAGTTGLLPSTATTGAVTLTGTLATTNGGTNLASFTSGGAMYATSTSVLTTGTLPLTAGGTGQTTKAAAFNALSPVTSTGDLIIGNGTNSNTRLPIGTNTYVLTSNGSTASWQPAAGGGGGVTSFDGGFTGLSPYSATTGAVSLGGTLSANYGGTGTGTTPSNGQLLIGNGGGYSVNNLTAGSGITITNSFGNITIAASGGGGPYIAFFQFQDGSYYGNGPTTPQQSPVVYWDAGVNVGALWFYSPSGGSYNTSGSSISSIAVQDSTGAFTTYNSGTDFSLAGGNWYANGYVLGIYSLSVTNTALRTLMANTAAQLGSPSISPRSTSPFGTQSFIYASVSGGINSSYSSGGYPIIVTPGFMAGYYNIYFKSNDTTNDTGLFLNSLNITDSTGGISTYFSGSDFSAAPAYNDSNGQFFCQLTSVTNSTLLALLDSTIIN